MAPIDKPDNGQRARFAGSRFGPILSL